MVVIAAAAAVILTQLFQLDFVEHNPEQPLINTFGGMQCLLYEITPGSSPLDDVDVGVDKICRCPHIYNRHQGRKVDDNIIEALA